MKDDLFYLNHILLSISKISQYTENIDENFFKDTDLIQDAVIRHLEIIGEASKHLSDQYVTDNSGIPWKAIAGIRDRLIHQYFGVDVDAVWNTIKKDIPE